MTQPDPRLWANVCRQCGKSQNDDHAEHGIHSPMLHVGAPGVPFQAMTPEHVHSYHLDCLGVDIEAQLRAQHGAAIDAAKAGKRGQELHSIIQEAAAAFRATEEAWLADEAEQFAKTGVANETPTHPMHAVAGA